MANPLPQKKKSKLIAERMSSGCLSRAIATSTKSGRKKRGENFRPVLSVEGKKCLSKQEDLNLPWDRYFLVLQVSYCQAHLVLAPQEWRVEFFPQGAFWSNLLVFRTASRIRTGDLLITNRER